MGLGSLRSELQKKLAKTNVDLIHRNSVVQFLTIGDPIFDIVSGGGVPRGRIVEVIGQEHSGKSGTMYSLCGQVTKQGGSAIYIDAEHAIDMAFNKRCYDLVEDPKTFEVLQPNYLEEVLDVIDIIDKDASIRPDVIVLDSIAACKPKDLVTAAADKEARLGMHAKMIGLLMEKVKILATKKNLVFCMVNQLRGAIAQSRFEQNQGTGSGYNPMESFTTPGGYAPRFYASLRMRLEYGGNEKFEMLNPLTGLIEEVRVANAIKVINLKNKVATPFLKGMTRFDFPVAGQKGGWNAGMALVPILEKTGHISYSGTRMDYKGHKVAPWSIGGVKRDEARLEWSRQGSLVSDAVGILKDMYDKATEYGLRVTADDTKDIQQALNEDQNQAIEHYQEEAPARITLNAIPAPSISSPVSPVLIKEATPQPPLQLTPLKLKIVPAPEAAGA